MFELLPASSTITNEITLIIPLGLLLLTMGWLAWSIHGRNRD